MSIESSPTPPPWWKTAVVYQIYPRSFCDGSGDGVGDLRGLHSRLEYLAWLGVDAIWISPFFKSPMRDFGYDVSDYCDVDPLFGTLADFDALLARAHALGLRVMIDWVPSHTSNEHPWFRAALADRHAPERAFYVFRDPAPGGGPPNGWLAAFPQGSVAWTLDEASGQYYLHSFLPEQPDLDWSNPEVAARMHQTLRFWLDRGVDGFRADVVHNLVKDAALPELPEALRALPCMLVNDDPLTHARLRDVRTLLDGYPGDRAMVGEVFLLDSDKVASYYGAGDELHLCFDFMPLYTPWTAEAWRAQLERSQQALASRQAWPTWVLNNHDQKRLRTRLGRAEGGGHGDELAQCRAACVLLLGLRGTPFLYMGEELGLEDAVVEAAARVDPGGRDGCRAPMPWTSAAPHGWPARPWLPFGPEPDARSVEAQRADDGSMLDLYRRALATRKQSAALREGTQTLLDAPAGVLGFARQAGDERCEVWINFTDASVPLGSAHSAANAGSNPASAAGAARTTEVLLASDGAQERHPFSGVLAAHQAVIVRVTR